jgi:hypothetical protein
METSHIVISLLVLSIIALVTYIIFNRKDDEDTEALKTSWMVMASEIFPLIEKSDYLNRQINVCDIKKN